MKIQYYRRFCQEAGLFENKSIFRKCNVANFRFYITIKLECDKAIEFLKDLYSHY